jgi:hypothetical protein
VPAAAGPKFTLELAIGRTEDPIGGRDRRSGLYRPGADGARKKSPSQKVNQILTSRPALWPQQGWTIAFAADLIIRARLRFLIERRPHQIPPIAESGLTICARTDGIVRLEAQFLTGRVLPL